MGLKRLKSATVRPEFTVVPLPGFYMVKASGDPEWLVVNETDSTNNVFVDADVVRGLLLDYLRGGPPDEAFNYGYGQMWTFGEAA